MAVLLFAAGPARAGGQDLARAEVRSVVESAMTLLAANYVFEEEGREIVEHLRARLGAGHYDTVRDPDSLAAVLTADLRGISGDRHLYVEHVAESAATTGGASARAERERVTEQLTNFGFTEARVLAGNVGYLRIEEFMHPQRGYDAAAASMAFLANTEALVIDVRGNGGGYAGLMELVLSYFFDDAPTHISTTYTSEEGGTRTPSFTLPFVPGARRVGQPLYVLVDGGTGSAAEFFAYTLQAFDKAVVVGELSRGAAHRNTYFTLDHGLRISISTGAPVNPVTGTNWEGVGVRPDVPASPGTAVCAAYSLALGALREGATTAAVPRRGRARICTMPPS